MGKSISPLNFHNAVNSGPALILTGAWIPGNSGVASGNVFVVKETGEKRYNVTDGATSGEVYLIDNASPVSGEGYIQIADTDEFVTKIYENVVITNKGNSFSWNLDTSADVDIILPSSIFPAQASTKTASIKSNSPDKLVETNKTISSVPEDNLEFAETE